MKPAGEKPRGRVLFWFVLLGVFAAGWVIADGIGW